MDQEKQELQKLYPGKVIFENRIGDNVTELLCEIEPAKEHPEYSLAIAIIKESKPHFHKVTTETYKIIMGTLRLFVDGEEIDLNEGDTYVINPGKVHYAKGDNVWVECKSEPGWTMEDHHTIKS